ncbi:hypothetical protein N9X24_03025 [Rickettsiales bacterium]|nr:hypothetical protein [Rickettsiales bacterium]
MSKEHLNNIKSLAGSIAHETRNSLSAIRTASDIIKNNLDEAIEYLDLISISSSRGLFIIDIILQNIRDGEIDTSKFTNLSMSSVVETAINDFTFEDKDQRKLVNIDLSDNFQFFGE